MGRKATKARMKVLDSFSRGFIPMAARIAASNVDETGQQQGKGRDRADNRS